MIRKGGRHMIFPDAWFNGEPPEWDDDQPHKPVLRPSEDEWGPVDDAYGYDEEAGW